MRKVARGASFLEGEVWWVRVVVSIRDNWRNEDCGAVSSFIALEVC